MTIWHRRGMDLAKVLLLFANFLFSDHVFATESNTLSLVMMVSVIIRYTYDTVIQLLVNNNTTTDNCLLAFSCSVCTVSACEFFSWQPCCHNKKIGGRDSWVWAYVAGKPGSSRFINFFTPSDLTRHGDTAFGSRAITSGQAERCKKLVQRLEPDFPARAYGADWTRGRPAVILSRL